MHYLHSLALSGVAFATLIGGSASASAQTTPVTLGAAHSFAVLGGSTITNTGATTVTGNLGLSPGSALTGFPPGNVTGAKHITDAVALKAQNDALTAYNTLAASPCNFDLTGQDLGGKTLLPGVYCFTSSAQLTGTLTLDGLGSDASVFIFKIGSTLTTASNAAVTIINGGSACNVFWAVGTSATLGTSTAFAGNVLASASITLTTTATVAGRLFALNGAVTLDTNAVTIPIECQSVVSEGPGCVGTGGIAPTLSVDAAIPGFNVTIAVANGLPGSTAFLLFGPQASHLTPCGCELLLRPNGLFLAVALRGTGSGSIVVPVPASGPGGTIGVQAFILDPGAPCGVSGSNAVFVTIG